MAAIGEASCRHGPAIANRHRRRQPPVSPAARSRGAGARPGLACGAKSRIRRVARAVRMRQVDAALSDRRLSPGRDRHHRDRRQSGRRPRPRPRHRIPTLRAVSVEDGARQHPVRAGTARHAEGGARKARARFHRSCRPGRRWGQLPIATLWRHEAAQRDRAHARLRSEDSADGRAVRRARRADPRPDAERALAHLAAHAEDGDLRHPRRAGGGLSRRPGGGDVGAAGAHQDHRRYQVRQDRSARPQGQGLRRKGGRDLEPGERRSHQGAGKARAMKQVMRYLPLLLLAVAWELAARLELVSTSALPPLSEVVIAWIDMIKTGELVSNGLASLYRAGAGLALSIAIGATLGIAMAWSKPVNVLGAPIVEIFYPLPKSALIPVTVIWLGFGAGSKILLIFLGCMLPVTLGAFNGARSSEQVLVWSARSMGAHKLRMLWDVVVPSAMPELLNGIRTALALSFILLVSSELIVAQKGFGFLIGGFGANGTYDAMYAVVLTVAFLGFAADRAYLLITKRVMQWRE